MPNAVTISTSQFVSYLKDLKDDFKPALKRGLVSGAQRCIPFMQARTDNAPKASDNGSTGAVNTGAYKAAWKSQATADGARVFNTRPYAGVIDDGRRASPVSKEGRRELEAWAKRKLHLSDSEAKSAAFAIARKLAKQPLRARRVMSGGIQEMTALVLKEVEHELEKALEGER